MSGVRNSIDRLLCGIRRRATIHRAAGHDSPLPALPGRPSVKPILPVADMAEAIGFYRALGFEVTVYDGGYAWVRHCGWELFHLAAVDPNVRGSDAALYLHVADADAWRAALVATGAGVSIGTVADMPWGMREFSFADPSGNVVRIGRNL